jgi:hypothetical protein
VAILYENSLQKLSVVVFGIHGAIFIEKLRRWKVKAMVAREGDKVGMQDSKASKLSKSVDWNAVVSIGIEAGEHRVKECNQ